GSVDLTLLDARVDELRQEIRLGYGAPTPKPESAPDLLPAIHKLEALDASFADQARTASTIETALVEGSDFRGTALVESVLFDGLLRRLGRRHRAADVGVAVREARAAGIRSVSVDLLYDVPGQDLESWGATLEAALGLSVDHVSAYALTLDDPAAEGLTGPTGDHLPTRPGARRWREAAVRDQDDDLAAELYVLAVERLGAAGYRGYEISNWGRPGHESRHNLVYWQRRPHEAVGTGAHAFDGVVRRWNAARLEGYLAALAPTDGSAPSLPPGGADITDEEGAEAEAVILALRLDSGLSLADAERGPLAPHLDWALDAGLLERAGAPGAELVSLTTSGRLLSNELFARLV
ncbi:MAG: hypothetical protein WCK58_09760, partial [Chloroflexota bacterium]